MADIEFIDFMGLNSVSGLSKESKNLYFTESKNMDIIANTIRRMRGQEVKLTLPAGVTGLYEHEIEGEFFLKALCRDGKLYQVEPLTNTQTVIKEGLSTLEDVKPYFFQFMNDLIVINGKNDPFIVDGNGNCTDSGFYSTYNKYGTCGVSFAGRIFIADGNLLAWTAANTTNVWTNTDPLITDAGYKENFVGKIIALSKFSSYLVIFTTSDIYIMSGTNGGNFAVEHYSEDGIQSRFGITKIDNKLYLWKKGLMPIEYAGDIPQLKIGITITELIKNSLDDIDNFRLNEIILIPYEDRKQIWVYIPVINKPELYKCIIVSFENYAKNKGVTCYFREGNPITCGCSFRGKVYTGTSTGDIYQEDTGNTFAGNRIEAHCYFNPLRLGTSRIKTKYDVIDLTLDSKSINKFKFLTRYDGEFYNEDSEDIDLIEVSDSYYVLNSDLITGDKLSTVDDFVHETVTIMDEWKIIQCGIRCDEDDEDLILHSVSFMDNSDPREF